MTDRMTRREFVRDSALAATAAATSLGVARTIYANNSANERTDNILNYNAQMEYRLGGKSGLMLSAVGLGGHFKGIDKLLPKASLTARGEIDTKSPDFERNRRNMVAHSIARGINYLDACSGAEVMVYAKALKGRRDDMYFGYSWSEKEFLNPDWRSFAALKKSLDEGLQASGLDHVDLWRVRLGGRHSDKELKELAKTLEWAKKGGKARFVGVASHDRLALELLIDDYHEQLDFILTPYTATPRSATENNAGQSGPIGLQSAVIKHNLGWLGLKPFTGNSRIRVPDGRGGHRIVSFTPGNPHEEEDNRVARLMIRSILSNPAITATVPGLLSKSQVDNVAIAVLLRKKLDRNEQSMLQQATDRKFAAMPRDCQSLRNRIHV